MNYRVNTLRLNVAILSASICLLVSLPSISLADPQPAKLIGVGSCASSNCHGGQSPRKANNVLQNEYFTWYKHDKHAQAFNVLGNAQSKKMASHLGIADPQKDQTCLNCHATYVKDITTQGSEFHVEDGVGCESCHGAAENWLGSHTARDATHEGNLKNGMKDVVSIEARTKLCLSCHLGTDNQYVSHRIMGAGHPRLSFEVDTFTATQPAHWNIDEDYKQRKGDYSPARAWLVGQVVQSSETIAAIQSEKRSRSGIMPELSNFSCFSCHHSLADEQFKTHDYAGAPGLLKLNISSPLVVQVAFSAIDQGLSDKIKTSLTGIHKAYSDGQANETLKSLMEELNGSVKKAALSLDTKDQSLKKVLVALVRYSATSAAPQYEEAEQFAMGMSAILASMPKQPASAKKGMAGVYASLKNSKAFIGSDFSKACADFLASL